MSRKTIIILVTALLFVVTSSAVIISFSTKTATDKRPYLDFKKGSSYTEIWEKVNAFETKGLPKSALEIVNQIYEVAKKDSNYAQIVKAIIYKMKYTMAIEEDGYKLNIEFLRSEMDSASFPLKPVLQSMLAETYWSFYLANRWQYYNRTETVAFDNNDLLTWSLEKILDETIKYYQASLQNADSLKLTRIDLYDDIMNKYPDSRKFRPTLYDFLAHRAFDFFSNSEAGITRPAESFNMTEEAYFGSAELFSFMKIISADTLSLKFHALKTIQELTKFHLEDEDPAALVDIEMKRLVFVNSNAVVPDKANLYLSALQKLEQKYLKFSISTEVAFLIATEYFSRGSKYQPLVSDDNKWLLKKAHEYCKEAIDRFSIGYGADNCKYLKSQIEMKQLTLNTESYVTPNTIAKMLVSYKNIDKIYFRIVKINKFKFDKDIRNLYSEKLINYLRKLKAEKEWSVNLKNDGDYQLHNTEIQLPALEKGYYLILASHDPDFTYYKNAIAYGFTQSTNLSYVQRRTDENDYEVYVFDRNSGEPLNNVKVTLWQEKWNYLLQRYEDNKYKVISTDENGYFKVESPKDDYSVNYYIGLENGDDELISNEYFYQYRYYGYSPNRTVTYFYTDRAIYRPGQEIHYKAIVLDYDGEKYSIKPNYSTTVYFYDVNYQIIEQKTLTTNEFGSVTGTFTAPQGVLTGNMQIRNSFGSIYVSVEEYKRPKFETKFLPIEGSYKLNQNIKVKGEAKTYAGTMVDQAAVSYQVKRTPYFPYSWYYMDWYGYYPYGFSEQVIKVGTTTTDENGNYDIEFTAEPDISIPKEMKPGFMYTIVADVTDINGETRSASTIVYVGYTAMVISTDLESYLDKSLPVDFEIFANNLSGEEVDAKGNITVRKIEPNQKLFRSRLWSEPDIKTLSKEEYYKVYPFDVYSKENLIAERKKGEEVFKTEFSTKDKKKINIKNIKNWSPGEYFIEIKSKDEFGEDVEYQMYFTVYDSETNVIPVNEFSWFIPVKNKCEPGETAKYLIGSGAENVKVRYEIEYHGDIVHSEWITLNKEQKLVEIPVLEKHRGNFTVHFLFVKNERTYINTDMITVPWTNKELTMKFETFRDKLYPGENEKWRISIKGPKGEKVAAEMMATLYDASLDAFRSNSWGFNVNQYYYSNLYWNGSQAFSYNYFQVYQDSWNDYVYPVYKYYDNLNWFDYYYGSYGSYYYREGYPSTVTRGARYKDNSIDDIALSADEADYEMTEAEESFADKKACEKSANAPMGGVANNQIMLEQNISGFSGKATSSLSTGEAQRNLMPVKTRTNFAETAFFYPSLKTNENGEVVIEFTVPESLTKWKMMGMAYTKDLKYGFINNELVTQKDLMVMPNMPRFFRENDKITIYAKVSNVSESDQSGVAKLQLFDAMSMKPVDVELKNNKISQSFSVKKGQSVNVAWEISIPEGIQAITYKITAQTSKHSDGEENTVPVLTNRMLVTESLPLPIRGGQTKVFEFTKLLNNKSTTLKHHKLTLEFTANPAWYAIQALPYLIEYPYECAEQTFSRYYANSIASHIANSNPKIKKVFDAWRNTPGSKALLSNLEKNQELKEVLLQETPWVLDAKDESERKRRVGLLFDLNHMAANLESAIRKLDKLQAPGGGWVWFPGMPVDRYMTQHIVTGFGHLDHLGVKSIRDDNRVWKMVKDGVSYLDGQIRKDYEYLKKYYTKAEMEKMMISYLQVQYLYCRSYFMDDFAIDKRNQEAFYYYKGQAEKYWLQFNQYMQGMIALALHRLEDKETPQAIMKSLDEHALNSEEMGMYWKAQTEGGYYWYQAPIETQALMIEAFDEITGDVEKVDALRVWLLKQKQTQDWKTTKATTEAVYALLLKGTEWLATESNVEIKVADKIIDPKKIPGVQVEAGTGYFKTSWLPGEITNEMGKITVTKKDVGVSWGAMYWQYFEQLDKITPHETPLKLTKKLFVERRTTSGERLEPIDKTKLKVGDKVVVRIELRVDRLMEYVHMKDMRASGFEPVNVISRYKYQDGLGYYEATKDVSTNFFFSYLPKGTYVFEYPVRVTHQGDFSNGITTIQCMYAPEFTSHSEGIRVTVEDK